ncbi:hypothetical protein C1H46_041372 [Malus baccata]|uniref:Uncharacterized protein n=1 Tax=Malus baccata TaxID=106549 RepID=A0A540KFU1_MALBA|nr:hypothetical protein C1H46_041372 [Malus baccata]
MLHSEKREVGHFHALVEGLLRHIRHSKKSKNYLSKGGRGGNGNANVALAANVSIQASQAAD